EKNLLSFAKSLASSKLASKSSCRPKTKKQRPRVVSPGPPPSTKELLRHDTQRCEAYHTSAQSGKAAESAGGADRARAMVRVALDTKGGWELAEASVHGAAAGSACQHKRSQHVD